MTSSVRAIGIRVAPRVVYYAVVEQRVAHDTVELLAVGSLPLPEALEPPDQLSFVRTALLDILAEFTVQHAGIRLTEYTAQRQSPQRLNIEGVVQEMLSSSGVEGYFAGAIARIAGLLGESNRAQIKRYFEGDGFMGLDNWRDWRLEEREAIVTAVAALRVKGGP